MPSPVVIYPGSFDPPTNGHLDLIARASRLADKLIVAVLQNSQKTPLFTAWERSEMLRESVAGLANVEIDSFDGLLVEYAARHQAKLIVRGVRGVSDYEAEAQMALLNRGLHPEIDTIFLAASTEYSFLSSRMVKEIVTLGGNVDRFVPEPVARRLKLKFPTTK